MATLEQKQETARENGRKSHGPVTAEGKARSSKNALTHGLTSKCVVMAWESEEKYANLKKTYLEQWQPQNETEYKLVLLLTNADWRLHRIWSLETATWDSECFMQSDAFEAAWTTFSPGFRTSDACCGILASNPAILDVIPKYEQRFENSFYRALNALEKIRRQRGLKPIENSGLHRPFPKPSEPAAATPAPTPTEPNTNLPAWLTQWLQFLITLLQSFVTKPQAAVAQPEKSIEPTSHHSIHGDNSTFPAEYCWFSDFTPTPCRPTHDVTWHPGDPQV
jgi:hypothetical protein